MLWDKAKRCTLCGRSDCPNRGTLLEIAQELVVAYRAGAWKAPVPPIYTGNWGENDWVRWIFEHGEFDGLAFAAVRESE